VVGVLWLSWETKLKLNSVFGFSSAGTEFRPLQGLMAGSMRRTSRAAAVHSTKTVAPTTVAAPRKIPPTLLLLLPPTDSPLPVVWTLCAGRYKPPYTVRKTCLILLLKNFGLRMLVHTCLRACEKCAISPRRLTRSRLRPRAKKPSLKGAPAHFCSSRVISAALRNRPPRASCRAC
jgi:hypothetical protein